MLTLLAILLTTAPAAEAGYCRDFQALKKKVEFCEDNEYFSEAAVLCLQGLEKQVKAATDAMNKSLIKPGSSTAQKNSIGNSETNYNLSAATLATLLAMAKGGAAEVLKFAENLELPEDADSPEATGGDVDKYIMQAECYSRADKVMEKVMSRYLNHIMSLERAKAASLTRSSINNTNSLNLDAQNFGALQDPTNDAAPPSGPQGKNWNASDISGTKKKEQPKK